MDLSCLSHTWTGSEWNGRIDRVKGFMRWNGHGGRMGAEARILLQAFEVRLAAEGWAQRETPKPKEYLYRFVNLLSQAPAGCQFDARTIKLEQPRRVK